MNEIKGLSCFQCCYHRCLDRNVCTIRTTCKCKKNEYYHTEHHIKNDLGIVRNNKRGKRIDIDGIVYDSMKKGCIAVGASYSKIKQMKYMLGNEFTAIKTIEKIKVKILD